MLNFKEYLKKIEESSGNTVGVHNDGPGSGFAGSGGMAYLPTHFTDTETLQNKLASLDGVIKKSLDNLDTNSGNVPLVKRKSEIVFIRKEDNPIYAHLKDGTRLYFTRGEYERAGSPEEGKTINVYLQRRFNNKSNSPSQVHHIQTI